MARQPVRTNDDPKEAPDPRAAALADRLMGRTAPKDAEVLNLVMAAAEPNAERPIPPDERDNPPPDMPDDEDELDDADEEEGDDEEGDIDTDEVDDADDEGDTDDEEGDADEDDEEDDEDETDDEDDDEPYETVAYDDDDLIEVDVDGETREVTLHDLKRAYSGEGAIEKRLKDATETRKAAVAERQALQNEVQAHRAGLLQTIQQLDEVLFAPLVEKPSPKLRASNINEYLLQQDAWEEDQKRIDASRQQLGQVLQQQNQTVLQRRQAYRAEQQTKLQGAIPDLADPKKARRIQDTILKAAAHYGYSPEAVAQVDDHGLFLMALDAGRYLEMKEAKSTGRVPKIKEAATKKRRRLKSGGVTQRKVESARSAKQKQAATTKAKSGKVDDVAAMLVTSARQKTPRGKPNGRAG